MTERQKPFSLITSKLDQATIRPLSGSSGGVELLDARQCRAVQQSSRHGNPLSTDASTFHYFNIL